jgi:hypothetical protein
MIASWSGNPKELATLTGIADSFVFIVNLSEIENGKRSEL